LTTDFLAQARFAIATHSQSYSLDFIGFFAAKNPMISRP
jgi:hypothetical protein